VTVRRGLAAFLAAGTLSLTLSGCDEFSVLGEFQRGMPLNLTLENASLLQGASTTLYANGGKAPYSFGVAAGNLYYSGSLGSVSGQTYTAGNAIGTVIIHLTDANGAGADAVATIVAPTPGSFNAQPYTVTGPNNDILVSWSYVNLALISGFLIQRSSDGVTFTNLTTQPNSATTYVDSPVNPNQTYYYRMYAVSGAYQSLPTGVVGSMP
jgi:hypothetical protein